MKKHALQVILVLILTSVIFAQSDDEKIVLFDEYGTISRHDLMSRITDLLLAIHKEKGKKALIRIYGGNVNYFAEPYEHASLLLGRINTLNVPKEKIFIEYCNVHKEEFRVQYYLVQNGAVLPKCEENLKIPKKTVFFESFFNYTGEFNLKPREKTSFDLGPGDPEYSKTAHDVLNKLLAGSPGSKIYLIAYLGTNPHVVDVRNDRNETVSRETRKLDKKSLARKMLRTTKKELVKNGIDPARIETVAGGYKDGEAKILEVWFVPEGSEIPKPEPDYFPDK